MREKNIFAPIPDSERKPRGKSQVSDQNLVMLVACFHVSVTKQTKYPMQMDPSGLHMFKNMHVDPVSALYMVPGSLRAYFPVLPLH